MSDFNLAELESAVLAAPVHERVELLDASNPYPPAEEGAQEAANLPAAPVVDLITEGAFMEQWAALHDMAGGMVQMRTGNPCPLGQQARSEGGMIAGKAAYSLIASQPALARLLLSQESTFWGQMAALGMHGFACVQMVKASATQPAVEQEKAA